jgi:multiple sugar transport system permease protein
MRTEQAIALPVARRERRSILESKRIFILPAVITALVLSLFPMIFSIALIFMKLDLISYTFSFNGIKNITRLLGDGKIISALLVTVHFVVVALPIECVLGLSLALLLNQSGIWGAKFFRVFFILPMMLSPVAIAYDVGQMLFHEVRGPINQLIVLLGMTPVHWKSDPAIALYPMIIIDIWQWTPFVMLILLAALQSIPDDLYDAVLVDGASYWQSFWFVVLPLIAPIVATVILIRGLEMSKIFETIYVVTGGGPGTATESLTLRAFQVGLKNFDLGYAATITQALLIVIVIGATLYLAIVRRIVPDTTS